MPSNSTLTPAQQAIDAALAACERMGDKTRGPFEHALADGFRAAMAELAAERERRERAEKAASSAGIPSFELGAWCNERGLSYDTGTYGWSNYSDGVTTFDVSTWGGWWRQPRSGNLASVRNMFGPGEHAAAWSAFTAARDAGKVGG